jgi:hypothetical protein
MVDSARLVNRQTEPKPLGSSLRVAGLPRACVPDGHRQTGPYPVTFPKVVTLDLCGECFGLELCSVRFRVPRIARATRARVVSRSGLPFYPGVGGGGSDPGIDGQPKSVSVVARLFLLLVLGGLGDSFLAILPAGFSELGDGLLRARVHHLAFGQDDVDALGEVDI